jgi:hypothetical protein
MQNDGTELVWPPGAEWMGEDSFWRELWAFALFLHGEEKAALSAVDKALQGLQGRPEAREELRARRFLFSRIRRHAPRVTPSSGQERDASGQNTLQPLRELPPLQRALAGLYFATSLPAAEAARVLGLSPVEVTRQLEQLGPKLSKVVIDPGEDPAVLLSWERKERWGIGLQAARESLRPQPETMAHMKQKAALLAARHHRTKFSPLDPAFLAFVFAAVLLVGLAIWIFLGQSDTFPGEEDVARLLRTGTNAVAEDYQPVEVPLQDMGDWFALQGLEGFWTPSGFAEQQTLAARVFSFEGTKVASVLLPEHKMIVYFFDGAALGIEVQPAGHWRFVESGEDVGAVVQKGRLCFLATKRGTKESLRDTLDLILPQG